jgi:nucleotide-binding universal stress UspA family protein
MAIILCATRGGEEGYRTQDKAIAMAKDRGDTLLFLYVVNLQFLDKTAAPIVVDVEDEISDMGEFLLLMAKERAAEQGVEANTICRKGNLRQEIKKAALEESVSMVLLGHPVSEKSAFQLTGLEKFAQEIESETGVKTEIV